MDKRDLQRFADRYTADCADQKSFAAALIQARGFLLDRVDGGWTVSDNAHPDDAGFLRQLVASAELGEVQELSLVLSEQVAESSWMRLFTDQDSIGGEAAEYPRRDQWSCFWNHKHGHRLPVSILQPFPARLVKALSAIGIRTISSGRHGGSFDALEITFETPTDLAWYVAVVSHNPQWRNLGRFVRRAGRQAVFRENGDGGPARTWLRTVQLADRLYENRVVLRELKQAAGDILRSQRHLADDYEAMTGHFEEEIQSIVESRGVERLVI